MPQCEHTWIAFPLLLGSPPLWSSEGLLASVVVLSIFIIGISPSVEGALSLWQFGPRELNSDLDPNLLCLHTPRLAFPLRLSLNYGRPPTVANYGHRSLLLLGSGRHLEIA